MRYFISLAYKGTNYHGWQIQPNATSIQECINKALSVLLKEEVMVLGAGRTDTGVHAKQMFAHFDSAINFDNTKLKYRLNAFLEDSIVIHDILPVSNSAHARFSAISRTYEYILSQEKNPFQQDASWVLYSELDFDRMNKAASYLFEVEDFTSFSKLHTDAKTNICDVRKASWCKRDDYWVFTIEADRFLRNMVRAIVGTLIEVGKGKMSIDEFKQIIAQKDRRMAGVSAPAKGLYLVKVKYPKEVMNG